MGMECYIDWPLYIINFLNINTISYFNFANNSVYSYKHILSTKYLKAI